MSITSQFVSKKTSYNMVYHPDQAVYIYYQICNFVNPVHKKFLVRKHLYNEYGDLLKSTIYGFSRNEVKKLVSRVKQNQYKLFSCYDFKTINYPTDGEILVLQSDILNKDLNMTGFRPIDTL